MTSKKLMAIIYIIFVVFHPKFTDGFLFNKKNRDITNAIITASFSPLFDRWINELTDTPTPSASPTVTNILEVVEYPQLEIPYSLKNERIAGANSVGDDRIFMNRMEKNWFRKLKKSNSKDKDMGKVVDIENYKPFDVNTNIQQSYITTHTNTGTNTGTNTNTDTDTDTNTNTDTDTNTNTNTDTNTDTNTKINQRIDGASSVGDDRIFRNEMKENRMAENDDIESNTFTTEEDERIAGANSVGDDRIFRNEIKENVYNSPVFDIFNSFKQSHLKTVIEPSTNNEIVYYIIEKDPSPVANNDISLKLNKYENIFMITGEVAIIILLISILTELQKLTMIQRSNMSK